MRNVSRPPLQFEEFPSGTDAAAGAAPLALQALIAPPGATAAAPAAGPASGVPRLIMQAPLNVQPGKEFEVQIGLESAIPARSGPLDFAFDAARLRFIGAEPGALIAEADPSAAFRATAPEGIGRLNLSFNSKADLKGRGELASPLRDWMLVRRPLASKVSTSSSFAEMNCHPLGLSWISRSAVSGSLTHSLPLDGGVNSSAAGAIGRKDAQRASRAMTSYRCFSSSFTVRPMSLAIWRSRIGEASRAGALRRSPAC